MPRLSSGESFGLQAGGDIKPENTVAIVLMPGHCLVSAGHAIKGWTDLLHLLGHSREALHVKVLGPSESGVRLQPEGHHTDPVPGAGLVLIGGNAMPDLAGAQRAWLLRWVEQAVWIWATGSAAAWLVSCGWLNTGKISLPENLLPVINRPALVNCSSDLLSVNGKLTSCRAGTAIQDVMLFWVHRWFGSDMARALAQNWVQERIGGTPSAERLLPDKQAERDAPGLIEAIRLMQSNLEEPLSPDDIAGHLNVSRRQLERWFRKHLNTVPSRYYKAIRLEAARDRVRTTNLPFSEIAAACGFSSPAHFTTAYRERYGCTPSQDRDSVRQEKI